MCRAGAVTVLSFVLAWKIHFFPLPSLVRDRIRGTYLKQPRFDSFVYLKRINIADLEIARRELDNITLGTRVDRRLNSCSRVQSAIAVICGIDRGADSCPCGYSTDCI